MIDAPDVIAERMLDEIAKIVASNHPHSTDATPSTIHAWLASVVPSAAHVTQARARGIDPAAQFAVVRQHILDAIEALKQTTAHMPANDPNAAKIADLIARLA